MDERAWNLLLKAAGQTQEASDSLMVLHELFRWW